MTLFDQAASIIQPESAKVLTAQEELALTRAAYARSPTPLMRSRLARMLLLQEAFGEVVTLFSTEDTHDFESEMLLAEAHLSEETFPANLLAKAAAERALALAKNDAERAAALASRGKCETRLGDLTSARATLREALEYNPGNPDACKRMAALDLADARPGAVVAMAQELQSKGANNARVFAAEALGHARAGDIAKARAIDGFADFHCEEQLTPPPGWDSLEAFNAALAEELLAHPGMRYERYGSASELTWRVENPARADTPLFNALITQIVAALERRVRTIAAPGHPWAAAAPQKALLRNWCVITESDGFETWHVHQFGWLSGVYYVRIPQSIAEGNGNAGCLAFGLPDDLAGPEGAAGFGEWLVRPREGMLLTFPSQCYHRTYPHGLGEKRICVAFDLRRA